jgi:glycine/D-amino acid oxidase-like deaminating enzyme/nitrite reductase/ring-hydroxylating ferredoxin subunit
MSTKYFSTEPVWGASIPKPEGFSSLPGSAEADVVIIGAGITGISTAYNLSKKGLKVIVLDSGETGKGTTGSSTGNLYVPTAQFHSILSKHGQEGLFAVVSARTAALAYIEERIKEFSIDCGFRKVPWFYFTGKKSGINEIEKEYNAMKSGGLTVLDALTADFPFKVKAAVRVNMQAQFNPLQYVQKLAAAINGGNCSIYENTRVTNIKDGNPCYVETTRGTVTAGYVVQATHTPKGIYGVHAMMEVYREFAIAVKLNGQLPEDGIYWDHEGKDKYSVRTYTSPAGSYLIVLDDSYKVGHMERTRRGFKKIEKYARSIFDVNEVSYLWAAQNYSPADYIPFIGTSPLQKNVFIATGFSADGLIYGTAGSMIISDLITGVMNPWAKTFDPVRLSPIASMKTIKGNLDVTANLISDYILKSHDEELSSIRKGESRIVNYNKEKAAAFRDNDDRLHVVSAACPHMGCIVHWNNAEQSWDCPCHGSRFDVDGKIIEGPAFNDLKQFLIG